MQQGISSNDLKLVQRQAFAGMLWNKQFYYYNIQQWLDGDPAQPLPPPGRKTGRNHSWTHLNNFNIISMPDKWEYPWYAAWDLAFSLYHFICYRQQICKAPAKASHTRMVHASQWPLARL